MERAPQKDNTIVDYINGKAIAIDEEENILYSEIPKEFVTIGETFFEEDLNPINNLPPAEQFYIITLLEKNGVL